MPAWHSNHDRICPYYTSVRARFPVLPAPAGGRFRDRRPKLPGRKPAARFDRPPAVLYNPGVLMKLITTNKLVRLAAGLTWLLLLLTGCSLLPNPELTISWRTESELDIIGFNLYRSDSPDGPFEKINSELIPPAADPFIGGDHSYVDANVTRGQTYYYQLESVDRHGNTTRTDPIAITAGR
jgi:hypothetical protein